MVKKYQPTFSWQIKNEITKLIWPTHCLKALLSSFITNKLIIVLKNNANVWRLSSQFPFILEFICNSLLSLYDCKIFKNNLANTSNVNGLINYIDIKANFDQIRCDLLLDQQPNQFLKMLCCKKAYIAGSFLACGSISSLNSHYYHLELRSNNYKYLLFIQKILLSFHIYPVLSKHSSRQYILYIKKSEQISDFLKLIGSVKSMMLFEDHKITKDFNMNVTRLSNLDISNINKATQAGVKQTKQIKKIMSSSMYKSQNRSFKCFCQLRLDNPANTLKELSILMYSKYNIKITKSGLNHLIRKINSIYNKESE